jgi:hypothetical protein
MDMKDRYDRYLENIKKQQIRESFQGNAISSAPSMLARLRDQVVEQLNDYNAVFGQRAADKHCRAEFKDLISNGLRHGFTVSVGSSSVSVVLQKGTTVICFDFSGPIAEKASTDCVEARPDDNGKVGYWHGKNDDFVDEVFISDLILDPVLCK